MTKRFFQLSTAVVITSVMANAMDPRILRLIGPDARVVCGIDVARYRSSALASLYPVDLAWLSASVGGGEIRELVTIMTEPEDRPLLVIGGAPAGVLPAAKDAGLNLVRLDADTVIMGDPARMKEAVDRWNQEDRGVSDVADRAQRLRGAFDLWFLAIRPLDHGPAAAKGVLKYRDELVQVIEEVRGGIRLGASHDISLEVLARTADDATVLAALGRWLPGLMQLQGGSGPMGPLVALAENLQVSAQGRTAVASFSLPDAGLEKLAATARHAIE